MKVFVNCEDPHNSKVTTLSPISRVKDKFVNFLLPLFFTFKMGPTFIFILMSGLRFALTLP